MHGEGTHIVECEHPPTPPVPPHADIRLGAHVDSSRARRGLAQLVFRARSAGPVFQGIPLQNFTVVLRDTLTAHVPPIGRYGDSTGTALIPSVPVGYTSARVQRIGYVSHTLPLTVRPGYTDTILVALPEACVYPSDSASKRRLQN
jgi:hypothetical protein